MKKIVLVLITVLLIINVMFPKSFMGRMYIFDLESMCDSQDSMSMRFNIFFKHKYTNDWNNSDETYFHVEGDYGDGKLNVITIHTSNDDRCYVYDNGQIEYKLDKASVKINAFSNEEYNFDFLTEEEQNRVISILDEAKTLLQQKINSISKSYVDKLIFRYIITLIILFLFWGTHGILYFRKYLQNSSSNKDENNEDKEQTSESVLTNA